MAVTISNAPCDVVHLNDYVFDFDLKIHVIRFFFIKPFSISPPVSRGFPPVPGREGNKAVE